LEKAAPVSDSQCQYKALGGAAHENGAASIVKINNHAVNIIELIALTELINFITIF